MKNASAKVRVWQEVDGYEVGVEILGSVEEYAKSFLAIFNNVKGSEELVRVWNDYGNRVFVVCYEESLDATKKFLSQFGEIKSAEKVRIVGLTTDTRDFDWDTYSEIVIDPDCD